MVAIAAFDAEPNASAQRMLAQRADIFQSYIEVRPLGRFTFLPGGIAQPEVFVREPAVAADSVEQRRLPRHSPAVPQVYDDRFGAHFGRGVNRAPMGVHRAAALRWVRRGQPITRRRLGHRARPVQATNVHAALGCRRRERAQCVEGEVGVRLDSPEAKSAVLFEKMRRVAARSVPRRRQPDGFGHVRDCSSPGFFRAGRIATTARAEMTASAQNTGS